MLEAKRRWIVATISLSIALLLFHGYVARALWTRGDEFLRRGNPAAAEPYYRRAIAIDANCEEAVDRLLFAALELRKEPDLHLAIVAGDRYLNRHPDAADVRLDRAMVLLAAHRSHAAVTDFRWLAVHAHDARFEKLASRAAAAEDKGHS
jgi:tetratricopeptide (TPR) repeat protein